MKNITVNISYDDEKLSAVKLYMEQKGLTLEDELAKAMDTLYTKFVPASVRDFLGMQSGTTAPKPKITKPKQQKPTAEDKPKTPETTENGE